MVNTTCVYIHMEMDETTEFTSQMCHEPWLCQNMPGTSRGDRKDNRSNSEGISIIWRIHGSFVFLYHRLGKYWPNVPVQLTMVCGTLHQFDSAKWERCHKSNQAPHHHWRPFPVFTVPKCVSVSIWERQATFLPFASNQITRNARGACTFRMVVFPNRWHGNWTSSSKPRTTLAYWQIMGRNRSAFKDTQLQWNWEASHWKSGQLEILFRCYGTSQITHPWSVCPKVVTVPEAVGHAVFEAR